MADKSINELPAVSEITPTDAFVTEQAGTAKKVLGQILLNWLTKAADGHGGIQSIVNHSTSGLVDTYRITLADTTTFDFTVNNGKGITDVSKASTAGLVDTYTISYNDGTTTTFTVTNGAKGDRGDNAYVWIRYASQQPTAQSHSFGVLPDDWMGIYSGISATAPTDWQEYQWFQIKGDTGSTGAPATVLSFSVDYMGSDSGTIIPSGSWLPTIPAIAQGKYLWTRITIRFNTGSPVVAYSVSRYGIDGSGAVSTVNQVAPDSGGNVQLTAESVGARPDTWTPTSSEIGAVPTTRTVNGKRLSSNIVLNASDVGALSTSGDTMTGPLSMSGNRVSDLPVPEDGTDAANKSYVDSKRVTATATISANWSGSAAPYTQTVTVTGVLATDMPHITPVYSSTLETAIAQRDAWLAVSDATAGAGNITFVCFEDKPTTAIPIQVEVNR